MGQISNDKLLKALAIIVSFNMIMGAMSVAVSADDRLTVETVEQTDESYLQKVGPDRLRLLNNSGAPRGPRYIYLLILKISICFDHLISYIF